jgi:hypothetical protein
MLVALFAQFVYSHNQQTTKNVWCMPSKPMAAAIDIIARTGG